ncbi:DUF397 domain-containing protein, partial [Yinghuangia aomiensis]|uniref:DUF397 domain-containing protein n=1 Tax=Yinghuangia aomiensis TaxID=676205 RepID=UPI003CD09A06
VPSDPHDIFAELIRIGLRHNDILPTYPTGQASSDVTRSCIRPVNVELAWRKSSYSDSDGGNCVEVASLPGVVFLRDSKFVAGPRLMVGAAAWQALVSSARS